MIKHRHLLALSIGAVFFLASGCAALSPRAPVIGTVYTDVEGPVTATSNSAPLDGLSVGRATARSYLGIVAQGDASIQAAMENGGISEVHHVDFETKSILGIYAEYTVIVYGRGSGRVDRSSAVEEQNQTSPRNEQAQSDGETSAEDGTAQSGSSQDLSATAPPYGVGAQWAAPAFGVSGVYDFTEQISGQAVLGFFGGLQSYSGRILYRFNQKEAYDLYGFGTVGVWRYSGAFSTESATGLGGGVGLEYSWQHLFDSADMPPLFGNVELGFVSLTGDFSGYNFSSFVYGVGIHYRFGN